MDPPFVAAFLFGLVAFTAVYVALLWRRIDLAEVEDDIEAALARASLAGAAVTAPRIGESDV